ncbi:meckelin-like isoform X2 [Bolinopsis microptera]|uniref:meckelin-like isoform X2 n=1 Tax=Bolinopsis microptera TaxID=2820187 RepID=UPI0030794E79
MEWLFTLTWLLMSNHAFGDIIDFPDYECAKNHYYNPVSLECTPLATGYLEGNGAIFCNATYKYEYTEDNTNDDLEFECSPCSGDDESVSEFGDRCISCPNDLLPSGICNCDYKTNILEDTEVTGDTITLPKCTKCIDGFKPGFYDEYGIPRKCVKCQHSDCQCKFEAGYCFPNSYNQFPIVDIYVRSEVVTNQMSSKLLKENLAGVSDLCEINISKQQNNITACQVLTNLCVLSHSYFTKTPSVPYSACSWLSELTTEQLTPGVEVQHNRPGWVSRVPWLLYRYDMGSSRYRSNTEALEEKIEQFYTFERGLNTSKLDIQVVSYTLDGKTLPISPLTTQLSLCAEPVLTFGTTLSYTCSSSVAKLKVKETLFHELYLQLRGGGLIPIPVLVENNLDNTETGSTETEADIKSWSLTRRFFLVDNQLGVDQVENTPKFVRYAAKISLSVTVIQDTNGNINVPLMRVSYRDVATNEPNDKVETKLEVLYSKSEERLEDDMGIAVGVMSFLGLVYAMVKAVGYRRRNNIVEDCSCRTISCFVLFLCSGLGTLFFWVIAGTSWYYLCIYKGQRAVSVFLPLDDNPFRAVLISCFVLTLISRLYFLFTSTSYDVFFIDWEKPKGKFIPTSTSTKNEETLTSVSIWRTYFLANEWNELHSIRKISPTFQYMAFLFFTEYVGLRYLSTSQPDAFVNTAEVNYVSQYSLILRVGIVFSVMFILWVLQRFYNFLYERFISDQVQMYIDLCSISNISVFILSDNIYGYYIHGRAVHGHADADMAEIVTSLKREEDNLCSRRGLGPDSEQQTFDMVIPILLRTNYNRITLPLTSRDISSHRNPVSETDKQIAAYWHINRLFAAFIDRSLDDIDYTIGDKLFLEKVLDMEIREPPPGKGVLYNDEGQSFEKVLYYGNEWLLFTWDVILIVMLDYSTQNFTFAALGAWFINEVILKKFSEWRCQKNVGDKALIDERFLL